MARNTPLSTVREMTKAELSFSLEPNVAVADDKRLGVLIESAQQRIATKWDFPFKETKIDVPMIAGTRNYNLPGVVFERPVIVETKWLTIFLPVDYGIGSTEYNVVHENDRLDPVQRWNFSSLTQFEVWPVPASAYNVRFTGQAPLSTLRTAGVLDDAKTLDLDDLLVAYWTTYEIAARRKFADAPLLLRKALERLAEVRASNPQREEPVVFGQTQLSRGEKRRVVPLLVAP